jgi:thimet oligopeptidase
MKIQLELPRFETTPEEIEKVVSDLIAYSKKRISEIGNQALSNVNFDSSLGALDELSWKEHSTMSRISLLHNVSPSEDIRMTAQKWLVEHQNWSIEKAYDPKVYQIVKAYANTSPTLVGEEKKLLDESLRDYRRLGLELSKEKQNELKSLQKRLSEIETHFSSAINEFDDEVSVEPSKLEGLDEEFIKNLKRTSDGKYRISLQYPEYIPAMEFAKNEELRKSLLVKKYNTAKTENAPRLTEMVQLRKQIAGLLGYASWNDYVIEERMAKTPEKVKAFLSEVEKRLRPKAEMELKALGELKALETQTPGAKIEAWDYSYYASLFKKRNFEVDTRSLRDFFPLDSVLSGFFKLIETLFDIRFEEQNSTTLDRWHESIRLFKVLSAEGRELGAFYLDLFPRPGKFGHAAAFGLIDGKLHSDGIYQRPVKAMVCNFSPEAPHLLSHAEVETLFHEFGHILHGILTWAKFSKFSGTSVAWDFVEAPSQILENWAWDYEILQMISKHHKDPTQKISKDLVDKMNRAQKAGMGLFYLRQLAFATSDLELHGKQLVTDPVQKVNEVIGRFFLPVPESTTFATGFGHLTGYASGYYGYAWADVMAADMFSLFKKQGLMNQKLGIHLRKEIYEQGSSRDETLSLEAFLGRPLSYDAFFESMGAGA